ncbi:MAG: hypothetical protein Q9162_005791 [Coniocarpon cinnabarinum]
MEVARGLSLRKKRSVKPKISAPKQISGPIQTQNRPGLPAVSESGSRPRLPGASSSTSSLNVPRQRGQPNASTADYVKRRYSTRVGLPDGFDASEAPSMPTLPTEFLSQPPAKAPTRSASHSGEKIKVDVKALQDPNLPADQYIARLLANATETDIHAFQNDLSKIRNRTSTDLQHNVYQNRAQFIKISQEAERLRGEMRSLRNLMSDLTNTLGQTNAALGIEAPDSRNLSARKYANRSSVANLEAMWSTHLQELWRRVEGSQKFLPAIPGRHVIHESGRWVELNAATFKPRRRVHLILLNDHLLVAVEKQRQDRNEAETSATLFPTKTGTKDAAATTTTLVADRCLPLQDIEASDLGVKNALGPSHGSVRRASRLPNANAINLRIGQDSFTYAATDADGTEKTAFLAKFRKAVSDLRKTQASPQFDDASSVFAASPSLSSVRKLPRSPEPGASSGVIGNGVNATDAIARGSMLVEVDGRQQSFRWVEQQVDELDIDVALQRHGAAVERIENLRRIGARNRSNAHVQDLVQGKVRARAARLATGILRDVADKAAWSAATRSNVGLLQRLGYEQQASDTFLRARGDVVRTRVSQCADTGDLGSYLFQLAWITFTLLKNTIKVYQGAFSAPMGSAVVTWAHGQTAGFNRVLLRHLGRLGEAERERVMEGVRSAEGVLREVGVDFGSEIGRADGGGGERVNGVGSGG